jgi:hypothetical protein
MLALQHIIEFNNLPAEHFTLGPPVPYPGQKSSGSCDIKAPAGFITAKLPHRYSFALGVNISPVNLNQSPQSAKKMILVLSQSESIIFLHRR